MSKILEGDEERPYDTSFGLIRLLLLVLFLFAILNNRSDKVHNYLDRQVILSIIFQNYNPPQH